MTGMKVLLRDEEMGLYYGNSGQWTPDRSLAKDFGWMEKAIETNEKQNLGATHVVLAYNSPAWNLTLPIKNYTLCYTAPGES
jgi:hypothetical protein